MSKPISIDDLRIADNQYMISLTKLVGQPIADIHGYLANEFDDAVFKLCHIILMDGTEIDVEGEHDLPYLATDNGDAINLDSDTLNALLEKEEDSRP